MKVRFILVRPRNPLNIGASARAMANFGFSDLVLVKPHPPVWRETVSAVGAEPLLKKARAVSSLEEAIGDCHYIFGTTAAQNRTLSRPVRTLPQWAENLSRLESATERVAILFGSEKTGLANRYLEKCQGLITIPTDSQCPSMNLSHSVAVVGYELAKARKPKRSLKQIFREEPPTAADREVLVQRVFDLFEKTGYLNFLPEADRLSKIRRTLLHWDLQQQDVPLLLGLLRYLSKNLEGKKHALVQK